MNRDDDLRELAMSYMVDVKREFHRALAESPGSDPRDIARVSLLSLTTALRDAEREGDVEPGEAESLLSLAEIALTGEAESLTGTG